MLTQAVTPTGVPTVTLKHLLSLHPYTYTYNTLTRHTEANVFVLMHMFPNKDTHDRLWGTRCIQTQDR